MFDQSKEIAQPSLNANNYLNQKLIQFCEKVTNSKRIK